MPFYPSVTSILPFDALPSELGLIKDGLESLFEDIHFRDFRHSRSSNGDAASYEIVLVFPDALAIAIPGTDIVLTLNQPDDTEHEHQLQEIRATASYKWPILGYVNAFRAGNFSFSPVDMYELLLQITGLTTEQLLQMAIEALINDDDPVGFFVGRVNEEFELGDNRLQEPPGGDLLILVQDIHLHPELPGIPEVIFRSLVLDSGDATQALGRLNDLFQTVIVGSVMDFIRYLITPKVNASLNIKAGLVFPRSMLVPLDDNGQPTQGEEKAILKFSGGDFVFSTERGIGFEETIGAEFDGPVQIGNTGLKISVENAKLDISRTSNPPEVNDDGRPPDFVGVFIEEAQITLPPAFSPEGGNAKIIGRDLILGTGGISGELTLTNVEEDDNNEELELDVRLGGGFVLGFKSFDITFQQGAIISSNIRGSLTIPGFKNRNGQDAKIGIEVAISDDGDFSITATPEEGGLEPIRIPNILEFDITSLSIGKDDGHFFLGVSGELDLIATIPGLGEVLPREIEIKKLIIRDDGKIEFEGGSIILPKAKTMEAGPVKFSVTAIHFGTHKQNGFTYNYFGFDGGVSINPGGIDARGDGIKYYFSLRENGSIRDHFLRIEGLGIHLTIPGDAPEETALVIMEGYLAMKDQPPASDHGEPTKEYIGAVSFDLPRIGIAGSAALRLNPSVPAFFADIGVELPTGIPLGPSGLGIYALRGLIGQRYVPSQAAANVEESDNWWPYYKSKQPVPPGTQGVNFGKFAQEDGFSIGGGVALSTNFDSGKVLSTKLMLLLSPKLLYLEGQAGILRKRIGLNDRVDPPFSAMLQVSEQSVKAGVGAKYHLPDSGDFKGWVISLSMEAQMGFLFNDPLGWYINFGRDQPEKMRNPATILKVFEMRSYLMLSASGIRFGGMKKWDFNKKFGPVRVKGGIYMGAGGKVNFVPIQAGGFIELGGGLGLRVFGIGFEATISTGLAAEIPKPFIISGFFKIRIRVKLGWFFKKTFTITEDLTFGDGQDPNTDEIKILGKEDDKSPAPALASNIMSGDKFELTYRTDNDLIPLNQVPKVPVIPMDSFIDVEFLKPVLMQGNVGIHAEGVASGYTATVPPQKGKLPQVDHTFKITSFDVYYWDRSENGWRTYDIYSAATALRDLPEVRDEDIERRRPVVWQAHVGQANKFNKLRVLAQDPYSYTKDTSPGYITIDQTLRGDTNILCPPVLNETCIRWDEADRGLILPHNDAYRLQGAEFIPLLSEAKVVEENNQTALRFTALMIRFPEPCARVKLEVSTQTNRVLAIFNNEEFFRQGERIHRRNVFVGQDEEASNNPQEIHRLSYDNLDQPVRNVLLLVGPPLAGSYNTRPLRIGASSEPAVGNYFEGDIDEVKLFNAALTEAQMADIYYFNSNPDELAAWWRLNGNASDASGEGHEGELHGPQVIEFGKVDQAYHFNGKAYIEVDHAPELAFEQVNFSFSAWIHFNNEGNRRKVILEKRTEIDGRSYGYSAGIDNRKFYFAFGTGEFSEFAVEFPKYVKGWIQVGATVDYTNGFIYLFINGKEELKEVMPHPGPGEGEGFLHEVCYVTRDDYREWDDNGGFNELVPEYEQGVRDMLGGLERLVQPIWRPDAQYAIKIKTEDAYRSERGAGVHESSHQFYFRTTGPVGHFHRDYEPYSNLVNENREDEFKLANLKHYLDYKRSFPDANGKIVNAKPLYFVEPKLALFFNNNHVFLMLQDWDAYNNLPAVESRLRLKIIHVDGREVDQSPRWSSLNQPNPDQNVELINGMIVDGRPCFAFTPITQRQVRADFAPPDLDPMELYSALFFVDYKTEDLTQRTTNEVHRYVFQTSRYAHFRDHVNDHVVEEGGKPRLFPVDVNPEGIDLDEVQRVVNDNLPQDSELLMNYADKYDRLVTGALKMKALPPAEQTIFNVVKTAGNRVLGILIQTVEPFNDPKLADEVKATTVLANAANNFDENNGFDPEAYRVIIAKEPSRIFITNATLNLEEEDLFIHMKYLSFTGVSYETLRPETDVVTIHLENIQSA